MNKLFHYTNYNALKGIIKNKELWLCSSLEMNDPFDRQHASNCVRRMVYNSQNTCFCDLKNNLSKEKIDFLFELFDKIPFYSVSFCKDDNEYLWENYADNYNGVRITVDEDVFTTCIQNYNEKFKNELSTGFDLLNFREVIYGEGYDYITKVFDDFEKFYNGDNKWYYLLETIIYIVSGTIKCKKYSPEKEYRLLFKNVYSEQYLQHASIFSAAYNYLQKEGNKEILSALGLAKIISTPKEHFALNISEFLSSGFITEIIIGKNSIVTIDDVRDLLEINCIKDVVVKKQHEL